LEQVSIIFVHTGVMCIIVYLNRDGIVVLGAGIDNESHPQLHYAVGE